jgi:adenylosuccinate lyase
MLERFCRKGQKNMAEVWNALNKFLSWLEVEFAVMEVRQEMGQIKQVIPPDLLNNIKIDTAEIDRIEETKTKHDVMAFLGHVSPQLPEWLQPYFHLEMTSYCTQDTGLSLVLLKSLKILKQDLAELMTEIKKRALEHKYTLEIFRTHGKHAELGTHGIKLANYYAEAGRNMERLERLEEVVAVGKMSGAVGVYDMDPEIERRACAKLGLKPIIATQIISRDIIAEYVATLSILAASLQKITVNIRLLSQTEIEEVREYFDPNSTGSTAMPHKKNPINSENGTALMRVASLSYFLVALENLSNCWMERSLDNSGAERIILADISILLDYTMARMANTFKKLEIFPENMMSNINFTKGLIFSANVMNLMAEGKGLARHDAHDLVRRVAINVKYRQGENFLDALLTNSEIMKYVTKEELRDCLDLDKNSRKVLRSADYIFKRVFGG